MKPATSTIVRIVLLIVALANMACSSLGIVPLDIVGDSQAYEIGSIIITAIVAILDAWKNNSFTKEAILADQYMHALKSAGKGEEPKDPADKDV